MIESHHVDVVKGHLSDAFNIINLSDKVFKKFWLKYMGEHINNDDVPEAKLMLVKMLCKLCVNDIEEVERIETKENSEEWLEQIHFS